MGPRHCCQLWMQSRPSAPGAQATPADQFAGGLGQEEGMLGGAGMRDFPGPLLQGRGKWKHLLLSALTYLPSFLYPLLGTFDGLLYWSDLQVALVSRGRSCAPHCRSASWSTGIMPLLQVYLIYSGFANLIYFLLTQCWQFFLPK